MVAQSNSLILSGTRTAFRDPAGLRYDDGLSATPLALLRDARELVAASLGYYGAMVTVAASAAEGLALLPGTRPDVLLSDIAMQNEDGYSFIRRVRSLPASEGGTVPAVALTAYAAAGDRARASTAGFQLHVSKPFDPVELARIVQRLATTAAKQ